MRLETMGTPVLWLGFGSFVIAMLVIDLFIFHRRAHKVSLKEALIWSALWVGLALIFAAGVWKFYGSEPGLMFLTGYLIEKALSVDNLFIFIVIFSYFRVPENLEHRVLFWGIVGAVIMRAIFIVIGAALLKNFHWIIYPFGALLLWTGLKLVIKKPAVVDPQKSLILRLFKRFIPVTKEYQGSSFWVKQDGQRMATPLLLVLITIEATDLVFAIDSIPAIFALTSDPFIVFTSNIFALFGMRSLYFALSGALKRLHYLRFGLGGILAFVGIKMIAASFITIPIALSLGVVLGILAIAITASLIFPPKNQPL